MWCRVFVWIVFPLLSSFSVAAAASVGPAETPSPLADSPALSAAREDYVTARRAIGAGRVDDYERLRSGLADYPLAIYLDYYELTRSPDEVRPADARRFLELSRDSPLPDRFLGIYLRQAGRDGRWRDFLEVMPDEPNSVDLKCYYFRARLAQGDELAAWEGAERLWVHGRSRPDECDPLFAAWRQAGQLGDDAVWARLLAAFDERQQNLLNYVARQGSAGLRPWSDRLLGVYRKPDSLDTLSLPADSAYSADIASHGLAYLARYNPVQARELWHRYQQELAFGDTQVRQVEYAIALHSLFGNNEANLGWLEEALPRLGDDKLVELRLRWALGEQDWAGLARTLPLLSAERGQTALWRYWQARAWEQQGDTDRAQQALAEVAAEREFYGFLAADRLDRPYAFNSRPLLGDDVVVSEDLARLPAVLRVGELNFHREPMLAYSEWYNLLQASDDTARHEQLAQLAGRQGWYRMAIDAVTRARAWDALDLRFPLAYQPSFQRYARLQGVPSSELMAIARRESAFFPQARSPVGAQGLMQLMPATGRQVAAALGSSTAPLNLYQVDDNVQLGSAYYRQLLDRFAGNRVFALTAYNAGPSRVDRWRHEPGQGVPVEVWIETIPYKETRDYVQAVLAYNVVFSYLMGDTQTLLTPAERDASY